MCAYLFSIYKCQTKHKILAHEISQRLSYRTDRMGCPITKPYVSKASLFPVAELEPTYDGKKVTKKPCIIEHQSKVITDAKVTEFYRIESHIGDGTFSDVFRVSDKKTSLPFAIKAMEIRSLRGRNLFEGEVNILKRIADKKHDNIVNFVDVIPSKHYGYIVMELATGGDLLEKIQSKGHIDEVETKRISKMLLSAVSHLHKNGITHRDLKPDNILFYSPGESSKIIITDFGFAVFRGSNAPLQTYCGTLQYLSPELIKEKPYTNKVDIWSVGVIVYVMLCGYLPFNSDNVMLLHKKITTELQAYKKEIWSTVSVEAKNFIDMALQKEPEKRFSAEEALTVPWLNSSTLQKSHKKARLTPSICSKRSRISCQSKKNKHQGFDWIFTEDYPDRSHSRTSLVEPRHQIFSEDDDRQHMNVEKATVQKSSTTEEKNRYSFPSCVNTHLEKPYRQLVLPKHDRKIMIDELFQTDTSTSVSNNDEIYHLNTEGNEFLRNRQKANESIFKRKTSMPTAMLPKQTAECAPRFRRSHVDRLFTVQLTASSFPPLQSPSRMSKHKVSDWLISSRNQPSK